MAFDQDVKGLISKGEYSGSFLRSVIYVCKERLLRRIVSLSAWHNDAEPQGPSRVFQIPCPSTPAEAEEIVTVLDAIDRKIDLHRRKRDLCSTTCSRRCCTS